MKTVVITGGAGFLGSHLCDLFIHKDYKVICLDNFLTGQRDNIAHLARHRRFVLEKQDVIAACRVSGQVHLVLHFASPASPPDYYRYSLETMRVGSQGTQNALELARAKKAVFLMASTSEIYGDPLVHPQKEDYWGNVNPIGPRSIYDETKRFAEALTMAYGRAYRMDTKIVRIFNTYGPRMRAHDGRAVPNFITQALKNKPLTVYGDGRQTRSFCYVSDLVDGIYRLSQSRYQEPMNIGNASEMTLLELIAVIRRLTESKSKVVYRSLPKDDPKQRQPDISRARTVLKWEPHVSLQEGLASTIAWFKDQMS